MSFVAPGIQRSVPDVFAFPASTAGGGGGGAVDSVFGRTGSVAAQDGDYDSFYVSLSLAQTISAVHTFNPGSATAPFALHANAQGQKVTGLNADLLDGLTSTDFALVSHTHAAGDITSGTLALARGGTGADLSAAGGANRVVMQESAGAVFTVRLLTSADIPDLSATYQPLDSDLTAVAALNSTGIAVRTAANTWAQRSVAAGTGVGVTNGDGVSGNPTVALATAQRTRQFIVAIIDPVAGDDFNMGRIPWNSTVTRLGSVTDTGTVTFNVEERSSIGSSGTDILSADQVADATGEEVTSSFANDALTAGNWLFLDIASVASTPGKLTVWVEVTVD